MINLSSYILTNEELSILQIGLKRGLATRPNQSSILAYTEDIAEQIDTANICRNEMYSKIMFKNSLRGIAFNLINIDNTRIHKDSNKKKIIQQLRKHVTIIKSDKSNGIVLFDIKDYTNAAEHLLKDPQKF